MNTGKKLIALLLVAVLMIAAIGCTKPDAPVTPDEPSTQGDPVTPDEKEFVKKACLITEQGMGAPFTALDWRGFEKLESEGWEVKCIEITETAEIAEQIRSMVQLGYTAIYTMFDTVSTVALDMSEELYDMNPDARFFLIDNMTLQDTKNCINLVVDSWEPSFVAGAIAAKTTTKDQVGWICHLEIPVMDRFRDGYIAGVQYVNPDIEVIQAYTGSETDSVKGMETAQAMLANYDLDLIYQTANLSGLGVIQACEDAGIQCIGVDEYQGDISDCVFWSALTDIDSAVYFTATELEKGWSYGNSAIYDISWGCTVYDERDYAELSDDMKKFVDELMAGIKDGTIDVYMGNTEAGTLLR